MLKYTVLSYQHSFPYMRCTYMVGSLKMNTALEYSTRVVQEGDRRCKKSTLNDLAYLTPLRIPLMNPVELSGVYSDVHKLLYSFSLETVNLKSCRLSISSPLTSVYFLHFSFETVSWDCPFIPELVDWPPFCRLTISLPSSSLYFLHFLLKHSPATVLLYLSWWIGLDLASDPEFSLVLCVLDILDVHLYCDCGQICTAKVRGCSSQQKEWKPFSRLCSRENTKEKGFRSFIHWFFEIFNLTSHKCTLLREHWFS